MTSAAEVIWTYLAHEHTYKGRHADIADNFRLGAADYPADLNIESGNIYEAVAAEVQTGSCDKDVLQTIETFRQLRWRMQALTVSDLAAVWSVLPRRFAAHHAYEPGKQGSVGCLAPGWLDYLELDDQAAQGHQRLLAQLAIGGGFSHRPILRDERGRTVIGDGRHRVFAAYRHATGSPGFTVPVFRGHL